MIVATSYCTVTREGRGHSLGGVVTSFNWSVAGFDADGISNDVRSGFAKLTVRTGQLHRRGRPQLAAHGGDDPGDEAGRAGRRRGGHGLALLLAGALVVLMARGPRRRFVV
jgi:hypothetical protein